MFEKYDSPPSVCLNEKIARSSDFLIQAYFGQAMFACKDITRTKRFIGSHYFLCANARINLNCPTLFGDLEFDCVEFFYVFHNEVKIAVCDVNVFLIASDCG